MMSLKLLLAYHFFNDFLVNVFNVTKVIFGSKPIKIFLIVNYENFRPTIIEPFFINVN